MNARPRLAGIVIVALVGAAVATLCDANHVFTGTLAYTRPVAFGQPLWVLPLFFTSFLVLAISYLAIVRRLPSSIPHAASARAGALNAVVETMASFVFVYLMSGFGNAYPSLLCAIFYGTFVVRWFVTYDRAWLLLLATGMAASGMLVEGTVSALGLMAYRTSDIYHVPLWLGGLYLHGAFAVRESMRYVAFRP